MRMFFKRVQDTPQYQEMLYTLMEERLSFFRDELLALQRRMDSLEEHVYNGRIPGELHDLRDHIRQLNGHVSNLYAAVGSGAPASLIAQLGDAWEAPDEESERPETEPKPDPFNMDDASLENLLEPYMPTVGVEQEEIER